MGKSSEGQNFSNGRKPCSHEGCVQKPSLSRSYCSTHKPQFEKYGFTWDSDSYPREKIAEWRAARQTTEPCRVPGCNRIRVSHKIELCAYHQHDRGRKGCSLDFYLDLLSKTTCECCGVTDRPLVTDHDHDHGHKRDRMCQQCIRGRICAPCNSALGYAKEDRERLIALAAYLVRTGGA